MDEGTMSTRIRYSITAWVTAIVLVACVGFLLAQQTLRFMRDPRMPDVPIPDATSGDWLFDVLRTIKHPSDRLGIWGWAASVWVYSGMLPATRETSTEFAFRDWGPDHYYRKRYLAALRQSPPEFFLEAVGPRQFMFRARENYGIQTLPELLEFVKSNYKEILDDGNSRLFIRLDILRERLYPIEAASWYKAQPMPLTFRSPDSASSANENFVWLPPDLKKLGVVTKLNIQSEYPLRALIFNLQAGPADRTMLHLGLWHDEVPRECDFYIDNAPPEKSHACTILLPESRKGVTVALVDSGTGSKGWLAVGDSYGVYADRHE